jgi:hypothetical protein
MDLLVDGSVEDSKVAVRTWVIPEVDVWRHCGVSGVRGIENGSTPGKVLVSGPVDDDGDCPCEYKTCFENPSSTLFNPTCSSDLYVIVLEHIHVTTL